MSEKNFCELLDAEAEKTVDLCRNLVRIPSEDPPGDTRAIAKFINDLFKEAGVESEIVAPHAEKPSVVATVRGRREGKHVVFNGHMDTFPVGDRSRWTRDPFGGEIADGKLYGRGAADMKGGLAASIMSVLLLNRMKDQWPGKVSITCVSDEEVFGPWGTRYLLKERPELLGDALINGEPSSLEHIRIGEKGKHRFRIVTRTAGGHGAYAGLRENAIDRMMAILQKLYSFKNDEKMRVSETMRKVMERSAGVYDKVLGPGSLEAALRTTMNVGTISGGIMVNLVAEHCEAEVDFRLPPGVTVDYLKSWLNRQIAEFPDTELTELSSADPVLTPPDHPLIRLAEKTAAEVCGFPVFPNYSLGGTEAYLWRSRGTPGVVYGPSHHNMGSPDEYIVTEELPLVTKVQALVAWRFLAGLCENE
ncbi:MAG: ArgE/DapE family deacylase [Synergistaceae bacterium]|jgi:succinyl-diaminopimelate desuccinylase|nr:ArgE/DapE family deacylase [Synergistaceae bacterium]